jgi:hypothetical protein
MREPPVQSIELPEALEALIGETWDAEMARSLEIVTASASTKERAEPEPLGGTIWKRGGDLSRTSRRRGQEARGGAYLVAALLTISRLLLERERHAAPDQRVRWLDLFVPLYAVAQLAGMSEDSVSRYADTPGVRRWLSAMTWFTAFDGTPRPGGMAWRVRLQPLSQGQVVGKPSPESLKHRWRSLDEDAKAHRTRRGFEAECHARTVAGNPEASPDTQRSGDIEKALHTIYRRFALYLNRIPSMLRAHKEGGINLYVTATEGSRQARKKWVEGLASSLAGRFGGVASLDFWNLTALTVLRGDVYGNPKPRELLERALKTTFTACSSVRGVKKPGAYLNKCLERSGFTQLAHDLRGLRVL